MKVTVRVEREELPTKDKPTAEQLLGEARALVELGFPRYATLAARMAIERLAAVACQAKNIWPVNPETGKPFKKKPMMRMIYTLAASGIISPELQVRLKRGCNAGNTAAHGKLLHTEQVWMAIGAAEDLRMAVA